MAVLWEYLEKNGRMVDVYPVRDSMFTVAPRAGETAQEGLAADRQTQIGRGLRELGIGWIAARSPQAKGRIERGFLTAQDRLVKQLRLAGVTTMPQANRFLEQEHWPEWNTRFARPLQGFPDQGPEKCLALRSTSTRGAVSVTPHTAAGQEADGSGC